jgi:hypothetical protein
MHTDNGHQHDHHDHLNGNGAADDAIGFHSQEFSRVIGDKTVLLRCDVRLQMQVEWLFDALTEIHKHQPLEDGMAVEVGWSVLALLCPDELPITMLMVCEPDFDDNPFTNVIGDVTRTLLILAQQNDVIVATKTEETAHIPRFDDTLVLRKGVLDEDSVYLERSEPEGDEDSGWYLGLVSEMGADPEREVPLDDYEALYVYELLGTRPSLMQALCLPVGYTAVFAGDEIVEVINPEGEHVWANEQEE